MRQQWEVARVLPDQVILFQPAGWRRIRFSELVAASLERSPSRQGHTLPEAPDAVCYLLEQGWEPFGEFGVFRRKIEA